MTLTRKKKEVVVEWQCRVCGSEKYESRDIHTLLHGVGIKKPYYCCTGCSILFENPEKFDKSKG